MLRHSPFKPTVLVTDAGRGSAIAIIRSLGRQGWPVIAADAATTSAGRYSRYAVGRLTYPPPETAPHEFVQAMFESVRRLNVDLIIPVTDPALLPLAAARSRFDGLCELAIPSDAALAAVTNKTETLELAGRLGVPIPRTAVVKSVDDAVQAAQSFSWPIVLKPQTSRLCLPGRAIEHLAVTYAENEASLVKQIDRLAPRCPVLLQEYCPGEGHGVELLLHEGRPLAVFQHRRMREVPVHGGPSALRESVPVNPILYEHSRALLAELRWTGLAMVEFKVGPRGVWLMEINGRVWGSLPLAVHAGMDFPARLVEMLLLGPDDEDDGKLPHSTYRVGVRAQNLELELKWIFSVLTRRSRTPFLPMPRWRESIAALAQLFHPAYKHDILSLRDPLPGLVELARIIRRAPSRRVQPKPAVAPCLPS
jgi:predicted ATP-grasp superfamily ATP-dependent carboligase